MESLFDITEFEKRNPRTKKGCLSCPLKGTAFFKKVGSWGKGEKGIAIVTTYPKNKFKSCPLTQKEQNLLEEGFDKHGIDLYNDCKVFNLVQCALKDDDQLNASLLQCCSYYTEKELEEFRPKIIIAFGDETINWFLSDAGRKLSAYKTFGKIVPSQEWETSVLCCYDFNRFFGNNAIDVSYLNAVTKKGAKFVTVGKKFKKPLDRSSYVLVDDISKFNEMLGDISTGIPVAFDYETNGVEPFKDGYKILTAAFAVEEDKGYCLPLDHKDSKWSKEETEKNKVWLVNWLKNDTKKVIQNWAFEELVSRMILGTKINRVVIDSMILQHLIDNRKGVCSQDYQTYIRYGDSYKDMVDQSVLEDTDLNLVAEYNALDVRYLKRWVRDLEVEAQGFPGIWRAYNLFHKAIPTFVGAKINGAKIDLNKFEELEEKTLETIDEYSNLLNNSNYVKAFEKKYKKKFNVRSPQHKQEILYDIIGVDTHRLTDGGYKRRDKHVNYEPTMHDKGTDKTILAEIQENLKKKSSEWKFIDAILNIQKYNKLYSTYIKGIKKTISGGKIHPSYLLHVASSFRSSCVAKGTKVLVVKDFEESPEGIPIEEVKEGDYVYCFDDDLNPAIDRVKWAGKTGHRKVVRVHWAGGKGKKGHVDVTPEHLIRHNSGKYYRADELVGDLRTEGDNKKSYKIRVLSCSRSDDRLNFTGHMKNGKGVHEHRLVYSHFHGSLKGADVVHHVDGNHYKLLELYRLYGLDTKRKWGNQFGAFVPGNHRVVEIEYLEDSIDVYDVETEKYHNFFANEICVHNSMGPNFQNIPVHDPILSTVRETIVPENDYFLSVDYSQNEVKYIAALSGDENLINDVNNGIDFHRKFAAILLRKDEEDVTTKERYDGKNGFVFPQFYGSNAKVISRKMGYDLMRTIKAEKMFWERYSGVKEFNERKAEEYKKKFYIRTPLGFYYLWGVGGPLTDENLLNSDIQGTAFHRLLRAWNDICEDIEINDILEDSFIVGQIHDSNVFDVTEKEIEVVARLCEKHMCNLDVWGQWDKRITKAVDFEIGKDFRKGEVYTLEGLIKKFKK